MYVWPHVAVLCRSCMKLSSSRCTTEGTVPGPGGTVLLIFLFFHFQPHFIIKIYWLALARELVFGQDNSLFDFRRCIISSSSVRRQFSL